MKRLLVFLLIAALLAAAPGAMAAEVFSAETEREAWTKALEAFDICALTMEYPDAGAVQGHLIRWGRDLRVYIGGDPTETDRETIDTLLADLALRVPDLPKITLTDSLSDANVQIWFVPLRELKNYVPDYVEGNWGIFCYSYNRWMVDDVRIGIATDVTDQKSRNHLIQEEFIGSLGLLNDHYLYSDSILYQPWTTVQQPSEVDWLMLNILYSPLLSPGMEKDTIHRILNEAWNR